MRKVYYDRAYAEEGKDKGSFLFLFKTMQFACRELACEIQSLSP